MGHASEGLENFLRETFLPCLLFGIPKTLPPVVGALSKFPVKKYGLGLHNPVKSAAEKHKILLDASCDMNGAVTGEREFSTADQIWAVKEERRDGKKYWDVVNDAKLWGIISDQDAFEKRLLICSKHMGFCMRVRGTTFIG